MLTIKENEIVSTTDIVRDFKTCRKKAKELDHVIIFKNNAPDLALVDYKSYSKLVKLASILDDIDIAEMIEERDKRDNGKRYTLDEVRSMRASKKTEKMVTF